MEISLLSVSIYVYIILFVLYYIIRHAVEEGIYRAIKRIEEEKDALKEDGDTN